MNAVEKLRALRAKTNDVVERLKSEIAERQGEIQRQRILQDGIDMSIKELLDSEPTVGPTFPSLGKYSGMRLVEAIEHVVNDNDDPKGLTPLEIVTKLRADGIGNDPKSLYRSIYTMALRLVESGKIRETKRDGKRAFLKNL